MSNILAVFGTLHGHTAKVVDRMADALRRAGHHVTIWKADAIPDDGSLKAYDAFLLAGSVIFGKHRPCLREFARRHVERLNQAPSAFVSVCGALAGTWEEGRATAQQYIDNFISRTGWKPALILSVPGALKYTQYGFFTRLTMRMISKCTGRPTDTSRDYEFTDWGAVERFAGEWSDTLAGARA